MKRSSVWFLLACFGVFCLGAAAQAAIPDKYRLTILTLPAGVSSLTGYQAEAIDENGEIVGNCGGTPIYWAAGTHVPFTLAPGAISAHAISTGGSAVGQMLWGYNRRAMLWRPGTTTAFELGALSGQGLPDSEAYAVNFFGEVAGRCYSFNSSKPSVACRFIEDQAPVALSPLPTPSVPNRESYALGISTLGDVVGWEKSDRTGGNKHAVLWSADGTFTDLTPASSSAAANAIDFIGDWATGYMGTQVVIWNLNNLTETIKNFDISDAEGLAMSHVGSKHYQIVGRSYGYGSSPVAFIWEPDSGVTRILNNLVPDRGYFQIAEARGLNSNGYIVGWGYNAGSPNDRKAFLLRPRLDAAALTAYVLLLLMTD